MPMQPWSKQIDARGKRNHWKSRLMPWIQMNILMWLFLCWSHRLRIVCGGRRCWSRCIENHAVSFRNLFVICYIGLFCTFFVSLPHNDISVISSMCISSLVVLNGWRRRRHGILYLKKISMYTLKFVCEKLQHTTSTCTNLIRTVLLYFFGKILFSTKYPFRM